MPMPYRACQSENKIFILNGGNSNSGSRVKQVSFDGFSKFIDQRLVDDSEEALYHALSTARVTKSPYEIEVMRYCIYSLSLSLFLSFSRLDIALG